ncbi:MAG TPA: cytochrome c [Candidatus Acidoferrum sp.]|nr:cytochrome c [Candidatus Acidoferrum sp.]
MKSARVLAGLLVLFVASALLALAQEPANSNDASNSSTRAATHSSSRPQNGSANTSGEAAIRIEGEKRFRTNCGRCHMPPHKFPPRVMAAAIRHMRVRAMLTDEDMRLILNYMTQ